MQQSNSTQENPTAAPLSADQLREAQHYGRLQLTATLVDKLVDVLFLSVAGLLLAAPLDRWLAVRIPNDTLRLAALYGVVMLLHELCSLPVSWWGGHHIETKFQLSNQTAGHWFWRHIKHYLLAVGFGLVMFVGLYWVIWTAGPWWWLAAAGAFLLVSVVLGQIMPVVILPLFYKIERLDNAALSERMAQLAAGTGLSIEGVYRMALSQETVKANAMLAGLGSTRRVLMGDTLLAKFSPEEIDVIFAHEIGHHVHRHIRKLILAGAVYGAAGFWLSDRVLTAWWQPAGGMANLPVAALPLLMLCLTVFGMVVEPLQNAVSRRYERQCDRYALAKTGNRTAYRSAFQKLAQLNKDDPNPPALEVLLFHSHPPIAERLALADE